MKEELGAILMHGLENGLRVVLDTWECCHQLPALRGIWALGNGSVMERLAFENGFCLHILL